MKERMKVLLPLIACVITLTGAGFATKEQEKTVSRHAVMIAEACDWIAEDAYKMTFSPFAADTTAANIDYVNAVKEDSYTEAESEVSLCGNKLLMAEFSEEEGIEPDEIQLFDIKSRTYNFEYRGVPITFTEEQFDILCRLVESEAGTEDIRGRELVVNVVLNRMVCDWFPGTFEGVVFERDAFQPVTNGYIYKAVPTEATKEAILNVFNGSDTSCGALYFMERRYARKSAAKWFDDNLVKLFQYGCHEFFTEKELYNVFN